MTLGLALRAATDRLTVYFPLFLMAVLAMGSWWLVRAMPAALVPAQDARIRQDPDYRLEGFSAQVFNALGQPIWRISGVSAQHHPHTDELHLEGLEYRADALATASILAHAERGVVGRNGRRVSLQGRVKWVRTPAAGAGPAVEVRGERLQLAQQPDRIWSDSPIELIRGQDRFSAKGFAFDAASGQYQFAGRAKVVLSASRQ